MTYHMENWEETIERKRMVKYLLFNGLRQQPCMWCANMLEYDEATIEHVVPASLGGPLALDNAGVACYTCNLKRGTRSEEEFRSSAWLQEKRRQTASAAANKRLPLHSDGFPMSEQEARLAAFLMLGLLDKATLVNMIMGSSKAGTLFKLASEWVELNKVQP